jgi:protein required for attachment to host cells
MPQKKRVWFLVADAGRARVFASEGSGSGIRAVEGADLKNSELHRHTHDAGTDRPGRSHESVGGARHAQEPRVDLHRQEKEHFAKKIADYLADNARQGRFDDLVLVAPPRLLGELRAALDPLVAGRVIREIDKDLTKVPARRLIARLGAWVRPPTAA